MIEINLLPGAGKKRAARRQGVDFGAMKSGMSGRLRDKFLIAAIVGVVISVGATAGLYMTQTSKDAALTERSEVAVRDSARYATFLKDRYRAEAARDTLLRQVNIIKSLDEDRFVWPHVLDEVSRALPQYTWLTVLGFAGAPQGASNVVISPKAPVDTSTAGKKRAPKRLDTVVPKDVITVAVAGRTVDLEAMTRFMKDLAASPFFTNIQIDKSEIGIDQGKEVTQFQLRLAYARPDSSLLRRLPLSMSVR